ncbi:FAD:protein FMN transferase [Clostridium sp. 'White wine YQ']|uniref:FAD:protein FMN transferase n=1 Tax=Clostridium sp. 'White wine YQ' TaxID=3027474 RepID=UPI002366878B|nr:FAD:protein FMN transferase [Clostridium sp. 'White wine YQ']MDD7793611.1 FAD:protein FMN transferase [Clostridium sp. 'White wine YQ']
MLWFKKSKDNIPIIKCSYMLGTIINLKVYGENAEKGIDKSLKRIQEIDDKMSVFKEDSEVSKINKNAGVYMQKVSKDTYYVLETSLKYSDMSKGTFDPTIRPLVDIWGFGRGIQEVPNKEKIEKALKLVNYKDISINKDEKSIGLNNKDQSIDLGAVAKGFAADETRDILLKNKVKSAVIDLGGNIFTLGSNLDGDTWRIGIQDPVKPTGTYMGVISVRNKSIVTSGNYERFFISGGKRYHHILDPKTGFPSENGVISVTIVSDNSIDGDALSTCAYVMGLEEGYKLIQSIPNVDAIFITEDKKIYITDGIKNNFKLVNMEYIVA